MKFNVTLQVDNLSDLLTVINLESSLQSKPTYLFKDNGIEYQCYLKKYLPMEEQIKEAELYEKYGNQGK